MEEQEMSASDEAVIDSIYRLFRIKQTVGSEFLRKNMMQEVIYYVLCGSCGKQFLQGIANIAQADEIYEANSWIKENFRSAFTVEELAEQRNMSVSLFHQKFKSAVGMGPLQCQKRLRLTEARRLMLDENKNVKEASGRSGIRKSFPICAGLPKNVWKSSKRRYSIHSKSTKEISKFFGETGKQSNGVV